MRVAIYDKGRGNFIDVAEAASRLVAGLEVEILPSTGSPIVDIEALRKFSHIICHLESGPSEPSWRRLVDGDVSNIQMIVRVSSQGRSGMNDSFSFPYRLRGGEPWILHLIERSEDVTKETWGEIFHAIQGFDVNQLRLSSDLLEIFDPHLEARLALRLLCEAWMMNRDIADISKVNERQVHKGIVVHAPIKTEQWVKPFFYGMKNLMSDDKKLLTPESTNYILTQMGDVSNDVQTFLMELVKLNSGLIDSFAARCCFNAAVEVLAERLSPETRG